MTDTTVRTETITIDGLQVEAPIDRLLLHVIRDQGIDLPTLCHDDRLSPHGGCRLCVVSRTDGRGGMVAACSTPVQPGMVIETHSDDVMAARRRQLQLLALNHRMECPVCERRGDCRFQDLIYRYGTPEKPLPFNLVRNPRDEISPVISRDPEKCILCGRCVRLCDEVQGVAAIGVMHRGLQAKIGTLLDRELDCEFCGQCVNACPVGALIARPHQGRAPVHLRTAETTTCGYCSCGCELRCETYDNRIERVGAVEESIPNHGKLCAKGWLGQDVHHHADRLTTPLLRKNGELVEVGWDEALDASAAALRKAHASGRAIVGMGTPRMTTEDAYQMQYLLRAVLDTPHVGIGVSAGRDALVDGLGPVTGRPRSTASFDDLASADLVFVLRADPGRTHPLVKTELMQAMRRTKQRVVLAQAHSDGFGPKVTDDLRIAPGTEGALLAGLGRQLLVDGASSPAAFADWARGVDAYTPSVVRDITGIDSAILEELATAATQARAIVFVVVCGSGIPGDEIEVARSASVLSAVLRSDSRRSGVLLLGEKANLQGVIDAGLDPDYLPGSRPITDEEATSVVEGVWQVAPPAETGWSPAEASRRAADGEIELLYIAGQNPETEWRARSQAHQLIDSAAFVIAQDAFLTTAAKKADVVFPVSILAERSGSFVGADGAQRRLRPVLEAPGRAPQDGQIFAELARRLDSEIPEGDILAAQLSALLVQDPAISEPVAPVVPPPPPPAPPRFGDLVLDTSPLLHHSGSLTGRSEQLCSLAPTETLRISPADANRLEIAPGQEIEVTAGPTTLNLRARVDATIPPGTVASRWSGPEAGVQDLLDNDDKATSVVVRRQK